MFLSQVCLPLTMSMPSPCLILCGMGHGLHLPGSCINWPPSGCGQWELLLEGCRVGGKEKQGYFFSLLFLGEMSKAATSPPWHQFPSGMSTIVWIQQVRPAPRLGECDPSPTPHWLRLPAADITLWVASSPPVWCLLLSLP